MFEKEFIEYWGKTFAERLKKDNPKLYKESINSWAYQPSDVIIEKGKEETGNTYRQNAEYGNAL